MGDFYIGLISGTSIDGIDAALVKFEESSLDILHTREHCYPDELRRQLTDAVREPQQCAIDAVGQLDRWVGECFRDAANALLKDAGVDAAAIAAIGSHGQTLRHRPDAPHPFTLQIGDPSVIAKGTGITTIADFRRADLALGGQGAPLTPLFHECLFRQPDSNRVVVNIGGIANITILRGDEAATTGFDTGPGNTLLDAWTSRHRGQPFDKGGSWAAQGKVDKDLLSQLLADPYFAARPPKSTGFEHFNLDWLAAAGIDGLDAQDVQATLSALTATSIAAAIQHYAGDTSAVFVCGGGAHNADLMRKLGAALPGVQVRSTEAGGLDPDWVEAVAFAWLARRTLQKLPGNLTSVTGATRSAVLGAIYPAD
ncbi:MAG: anhydro-N-acetylmuramic acid kinase [Gammaproteobacteria bacterium]|jgi:anhydro-N-acetylmuramic acid kinase|nr:anhydro-N-acetylmuramic acid kinase [Gammaproteobacteria bacterium]MDH3749931.1 anhydro-N-acetylmuramic acid kinase [Gammaproteobacteria bacterium]MDH3806837.1 anhydro-N-acetylmuramic acid kinase [Gammaproteobacteria bacterium]